MQAKQWALHCQGVVNTEYLDNDDPNVINILKEKYNTAHVELQNIKGTSNGRLDHLSLYRALEKFGYNYSSTFQLLQDIHCNENGQAAASMKSYSGEQTVENIINKPDITVDPAALDALL